MQDLRLLLFLFLLPPSGCQGPAPSGLDEAGSEGLAEGEGEGGCALDCVLGEWRCAGELVQLCSDFDGDGCREWGGDLECLAGSRCEQGRCVARCQPECALGEAVCHGEAGVRTCGDVDGDGCLELSLPVACGSDQRCDSGRCVAQDQPCADECAAATQVCSEGGRRICGQFDADPCLELSPTLPCNVGEVCRDGECLPDCQDECEPGQVRCDADGVVTCGNFDRDRCLELSPRVPCGAEERCDNGRCVAATEPCEDECEAEGQKVCTAAATGYRQCGRYDEDPCLELSSAVDCGPGFRCEDGRCVPTCEDECEAGSRECRGETDYAVCGAFDPDPCLEWSGPRDCGEAQRCDDGICVETERPCTDSCTPRGALACGAAGLRLVCDDHDADPCLEWGSTEGCAAGRACVEGECVWACEEECATVGPVCVGQGVASCGNLDEDPCLELAAPVPCEAGESCVEGECQLMCVDECGTDGEQRCDPAGQGYQMCGAYDDDPCRDWSSANPCRNNERCEGGRCQPVCLDECQPTDRRCVGNSYQVCGNFDPDPCVEYGGGDACDGDQACADGFCQVVCDHECGEQATRCVEAGTFQQCGNYDEDPCRDWSSPIACRATARCRDDRCQEVPPPPGVIINELLYDAPDADEPGVFLELYGPPATDLRGFQLVGVNGNGNEVYATITLTGVIPPDGHFVIAHTQAAQPLKAEADQLSPAADLQNGPDAVLLRWGDQVVDALGYGTEEGLIFRGEGEPARLVAAGESLSRDADHTDTQNNRVDFQPATPSPGQAGP